MKYYNKNIQIILNHPKAQGTHIIYLVCIKYVQHFKPCAIVHYHNLFWQHRLPT